MNTDLNGAAAIEQKRVEVVSPNEEQLLNIVPLSEGENASAPRPLTAFRAVNQSWLFI